MAAGCLGVKPLVGKGLKKVFQERFLERRSIPICSLTFYKSSNDVTLSCDIAYKATHLGLLSIIFVNYRFQGF